MASDNVYISSGEDRLTIEVIGQLARPMRLEMAVIIYDLYEMPLASFSPGHERDDTEIQPSGAFRLQRSMMLPRIMRGEYYLNLLLTHPGKKRWVTIEQAVRLITEGSPTITGEIFNYHRGLGWVLLSEKR